MSMKRPGQPPDMTPPGRPAAPLRVHHSHRRVAGLGSVLPDTVAWRKPRGLWWAAPGTWAGLWDGGAGGLPKRGPGRHAYALQLSPDVRLLTLACAQDVLAFTARFGLNPGPGIFLPPDPQRERPDTGHPRVHVSVIAWSEVHAEYDAIEVTPDALLVQGRPRLDWLDIDWALPSGCLWRPGSSHLLPFTPKSPAPGGLP